MLFFQSEFSTHSGEPPIKSLGVIQIIQIYFQLLNYFSCKVQVAFEQLFAALRVAPRKNGGEARLENFSMISRLEILHLNLLTQVFNTVSGYLWIFNLKDDVYCLGVFINLFDNHNVLIFIFASTKYGNSANFHRFYFFAPLKGVLIKSHFLILIGQFEN